MREHIAIKEKLNDISEGTRVIEESKGCGKVSSASKVMHNESYSEQIDVATVIDSFSKLKDVYVL